VLLCVVASCALVCCATLCSCVLCHPVLLHTDNVVSKEPSVSSFNFDAAGPYPHTDPQAPFVKSL